MSIKEKIAVFFKGVLMGTCDIIPGVSGGTIAFITGIYDTFLDSLNAINAKNIKLAFTGNFKTARKNINGNFLLILFGGIFVAILTLANLISYLLINYSIYVFGFFLGLIGASAIFMLQKIKKQNRNLVLVLILILGVGIGYWLANMPPIDMGTGNLTMLVSGAIAIIAMILPGISGSYILLMLGQYTILLGYVTSLTHGDWWAIIPIIFFCVGALIGIILFSKGLHYIKTRWYNKMIVILTGIMIGSLPKLRPWKQTVETMIDRHGEEIPLIQENILPTINGEFWVTVVLVIFGFLLIFLVNYLANRKG